MLNVETPDFSDRYHKARTRTLALFTAGVLISFFGIEEASSILGWKIPGATPYIPNLLAAFSIYYFVFSYLPARSDQWAVIENANAKWDDQIKQQISGYYDTLDKKKDEIVFFVGDVLGAPKLQIPLTSKFSEDSFGETNVRVSGIYDFNLEQSNEKIYELNNFTSTWYDKFKSMTDKDDFQEEDISSEIYKHFGVESSQVEDGSIVLGGRVLSFRDIRGMSNSIPSMIRIGLQTINHIENILWAKKLSNLSMQFIYWDTIIVGILYFLLFLRNQFA